MERKFGLKATKPRRSDDGNRGGRRTERPFKSREDKPFRSREERPFRSREERQERPERPFRSRSERQERPERPFRSREERPFRGRDERPFKTREDRSFRKPYKAKDKFEEKEDFKLSGEMRLNRFIANSGVCSRREADTYIQTGLVSVNGKIVTELGTKVKATDDIRFNGQRLKGEKKVYIIMNKPKDFVTTLSDPHADRTVMDLISKDLCPERVYPVGRLDKATTGILLFTNDGEMTEHLTHPSNNIKKIYHAFLDRPLEKQDFDSILNGIELEDGPIAADSLAYVNDEKTEAGLEIHSGRNRIVRRIFEHLGYKVKKLDRVYFAGLTKKNIRRGEWRFLTEKEVNMLKMGAVE